MPVEMPNKNLFQPIYTGLFKRPHALFGKKYIQHQFKSNKWQRSSQNEQYKGMVNVLRRDLKFRRLEENSHNEKSKKTVKNLRTVCQKQRQEIKDSKQGDPKQIRAILVEHIEMQRLYQNQNIVLANKNIMHRNFIKRKENDKLKYKLDCLSAKYKELLFEQSRLEDRYKYDCLETNVMKETEALRPILKDSKTRISAFKMINRCYINMIDTLRHDELYYHPVLDSLELDITEQSKFIQHVILLGVPNQIKYQHLINEYRHMEEQTHLELKKNIQFIADKKQEVLRIEKEMKNQDINFKLTPRNYNKTTDSMVLLNAKEEVLHRTLIDLAQATVAGNDNEDVIERIENCEQTNIDDKKALHRYEKILNILSETEIKSKKMIEKLNCNSDKNDKLPAIINYLKSEIQKEKLIRGKCDENISKTGDILSRLMFALHKLLEIMRHVGRERNIINSNNYPNDELKLPLLEFNLLPYKIRPRPDDYEDRYDKLIELAKDKVRELVTWLPKKHAPKDILKSNTIYTKLYVDNVEKNTKSITKEKHSTSVVSLVEDRPCQDPNILCRPVIKARSAQIVEAERIKREFGLK